MKVRPATTTGDSRQGRQLFAAAKRTFSASEGTPEHKAGFALLKQAAELGCVGAHEWLAFVYDHGHGTRRNRRLAFQHYLAAAEAGSAYGEYHVGACYYDGTGVRKNYRLAVLWAQRAANPKISRSL